MTTGYAIVLASGELERIMAVSNIAAVAAASEVPVDIFATMEGLEAFDRQTVADRSWEGGPIAEAMLSHGDVEVPLFTESFERAKELGPLSLYACELSMDLMDRTLSDYVDLFDDVLGVSGFLTKAQDKQVIFV